MTPRGYDRTLYVLPFDHRGSFETGLFGWHGDLTPEQTAKITAAKQVIYDGFKAAIAAGARIVSKVLVLRQHLQHYDAWPPVVVLFRPDHAIDTESRR